jgi:hypothetical protein
VKLQWNQEILAGEKRSGAAPATTTMGHLRLHKRNNKACPERSRRGQTEETMGARSGSMLTVLQQWRTPAVAPSSGSVPAHGRGEGRTGAAIRKRKRTAVRQQLTKAAAAAVGFGRSTASGRVAAPTSLQTERRRSLTRRRSRRWP